MSKEDVLLFGSYGMRGAGKSYYEKLKEKDKEIERLKERLDIAQIAYLSVNEKNNKAIEYIEKNCIERGEGKWAYRTINADNVINILEGVDKE